MDRRERLMENYENALFALLMDEVAAEQGKQLLKENARLKHDPAAAVPDSVHRRSRQTLRRAFSRDERGHVLRLTGRVLNKVLLAAVLAASLFVTAYAVSPDVRVETLNMLIQASDVASRLNLAAEEREEAAEASAASEEDLLLGYALPTVPEGFEESEREVSSRGAWTEYRKGTEEIVYLEISSIGDLVVDSEVNKNTDAEPIRIQGFDGLLVEKEQRIHISWGDTEHGCLINFVCIGVNRDMAIGMANEIIFVG